MKVKPGQAEIRKFLVGAVINPNKKGDNIAQQFVEIGDPSYFETRVVEYMQEARRLRERMRTTTGKGLATLKEQYTLTLTKAATALAISAGKINGPNPSKTQKRAGSKNPRGSGAVPPSEGMGGDGNPR